jgi:Mor family transcriptional regulator
VSESRDVVSDILDRVLATLPGCTPEMVQDLEITIRREWGGERHYVKKPDAITPRLHEARQALRQGAPIAEVKAEYGISRSTIYNILKKK